MDPVTICNMALGWIGGNRIRNLNAEEPSSVEEELMADQFDPVVRAALEEKAWLFATGSKPVDLGAPQETGDPRFPVRFAKDPLIVSVRAVYDTHGDPLTYERRDEWIVTADTDKAFAVCTMFVNDPRRWTPTFCRAVAHRLAADNAMVISESEKLALKHDKLYYVEIAKAGTLDGIQGSGVQMVRTRGASPASRR